MEPDNLSYQKGTGSKPLREPVLTVPPVRRILIKGGQGPYSKDHTKGGAKLVPAIVYVLSGGEDREKMYFNNLKNDKMLSTCVQVLFQSKKGQGLQPYQMNEIWQQGRKRGKINIDGKDYRLSKVDKVFLVSDVDEFESQLVSALSKKDNDDYGQWVISNPCIEVWLYYCFEKDLAPEILKLRYITRAKRSQRMKYLNHLFIRGGADPRKAFDNTPAGITNSKSHYRTGHYKIPKLFATSFHLMMEQIIAFINERGRSFAEYQEEKRKNIEAFLAGR